MNEEATQSQRLATALERQFFCDSEPMHIDDELLFAFVDGTLARPESEIVLSHVEECELCRADLEDLRRVRRKRGHANPRWALAAMAASLVVVAGVLLLMKPVSFPQRVKAVANVQVPPPQPPAPSAPHERWTAVVDAALSAGIERPKILDLVQYPASGLRGTSAPSPGSALGPLRTAIDDARPMFRWAVPAPVRAVVAVFRNGQEVARSPELTAPGWRCDRDLPRGATYQWQVELQGKDEKIIPAPPQPPAMFHLISAAEHEEIAEAKRAAPDDHLLLGILYARSGVIWTAEEELKSYAAVHPGSDAERFLRTVRSWK
jgi:hypothetical protein